MLVAGAGSQILGCDIAFSELLAAGQIDRLPRRLVGQPEHWSTIADTFNGVDRAGRGERVPTVAGGAPASPPPVRRKPTTLQYVAVAPAEPWVDRRLF
ncbi:hypothetical protein [Micromonospora sp. NPDC005203]|uniref:hypothetical protein n=1 Tax=Micromonospora sp. NPDC005203 TaxID=3364226 RepID=UPI003675E921